MNLFDFNRKIFRRPEGEDGGGYSDAGTSAGDPPAAEQDDKFSRLEARLERLSSRLESADSDRKTASDRQRLREYDDNLSSAVKAAEDNIAAAERALAVAHDEGDSVEIARAQRTLSENVAKTERARADLDSYRARVKEAEARRKDASSSDNVDRTNLNAWKAKNSSWYGVDDAMTKASHEIDRQVRGAGVYSVGCKEYFDAVDRAMRERFPDKFGGTPATGAPSSGRPTSTQSRDRGKISQSVAEGWRRMGIDVDDPKVVERMLGHRDKAVQMGILPDTPVQGAIRTR